LKAHCDVTEAVAAARGFFVLGEQCINLLTYLLTYLLTR